MTNDNVHSCNEDLWTQIELLVEAELDTKQRSELLLRLDERPALWRSLALAFVEQQVLRESIKSSCRQEHDVPQLPAAVKLASKKKKFRKAERGLRLATALSIGLLLFVAGFGLGNYAYSNPRSSLNLVSAFSNDTLTPSDDGRSADESTDQHVASDQELTDGEVVGHMRWMSRTGVRLSPVFHGTIKKDWLDSNPPVIDEQILKRFERVGVQVQPQRKLISLELRDQQYTVPMDDLMFRPARREVY